MTASDLAGVLPVSTSGSGDPALAGNVPGAVARKVVAL
jgi:hypothetical protein